MPDVETLYFSYAECSDPGLVRHRNEDALRVDAGLQLLLLADGMGGYSGGEIASAMAIEQVHGAVRAAVERLGRRVQGAQANVLRYAVLAAHEAIRHAARNDPRHGHMGATFVAAWLTQGPFGRGDVASAVVAHVGDSRLYRWRAGSLEQITRDHSLFEETIARGYMSREQAERSINRAVVTRALGGALGDALEVEISEIGLQPDDLLLLCSDGLSDMLSHAELTRLISEGATDPDELAQALVDAANRAGGNDNISVILARIGTPA